MDDGQLHKSVTDGNRDSKFAEGKSSDPSGRKQPSQRRSAIFTLLGLAVFLGVLWLIFSL